MEKLVYLLFEPSAQPAPAHERDALRARLLGDVAAQLPGAGALALTVNVADGDSDVPTPMPWPADEPRVAAEVSVWLDCHDRRGPVESVLRDVGRPLAGYLVSEALYRDYGGNRFSGPRDWPDGVRSPGILMLTLLERPSHMAHADWIAHWHGTQSPVSEAIQPRMRYVRNEVIRALTPGAPPWEGVVEECWPSPGHMTDPMQFYLAEGSKERLQRHVARMMESVQGFLELPRIRSVNMSEYLVRSLRPPPGAPNAPA